MEKYDAKCRIVDDGYLLLKGSHIASSYRDSCGEGIIKLRKQYASIISADYVLLDDILLGSSSAAAKFVSGTSLNGKEYWKNKDGVLLKNILGDNE